MRRCGAGWRVTPPYLGYTRPPRRYDLERERLAFNCEMHECHICMCSKLGGEFARLVECGHHFCVDCLSSYCHMHVREGTVQQLVYAFRSLARSFVRLGVKRAIWCACAAGRRPPRRCSRIAAAAICRRALSHVVSATCRCYTDS